jgi:hypothetical protein
MAGPNDALAILTAGAVFDRKRLTRDSELVQPRQVRSRLPSTVFGRTCVPDSPRVQNQGHASSQQPQGVADLPSASKRKKARREAAARVGASHTLH